MSVDPNRAPEFIEKWDAHRANRSKVARSFGLERKHAYETAERFRKLLGIPDPSKENSPQPSS